MEKKSIHPTIYNTSQENGFINPFTKHFYSSNKPVIFLIPLLKTMTKTTRFTAKRSCGVNSGRYGYGSRPYYSSRYYYSAPAYGYRYANRVDCDGNLEPGEVPNPNLVHAGYYDDEILNGVLVNANQGPCYSSYCDNAPVYDCNAPCAAPTRVVSACNYIPQASVVTRCGTTGPVVYDSYQDVNCDGIPDYFDEVCEQECLRENRRHVLTKKIEKVRNVTFEHTAYQPVVEHCTIQGNHYNITPLQTGSPYVCTPPADCPGATVTMRSGRVAASEVLGTAPVTAGACNTPAVQVQGVRRGRVSYGYK